MSEDAEKPADDGVDDSEDSDTVENAQSGEDRPSDLTPEQVEAFRRRIEKIGRVPETKLPDMSFKNFDTMAKIINQTMKNPTLELEADWKKKISAMLPAVKAHAAWQKRIDALMMPKALKFSTIDFTVFDAASRIVEQQTAWLRNLDTAIAAMQASFYPRNLRAIADLEWEDVEQVVMVDGIPLYGVVRTEIAEALIRADSTDERREILGHRLADISADCRTAVRACTSEPVAPYVPFVINALDALDAGYTESAQALAGSLVDTIVSGYFGDNRTKYTPHPPGQAHDGGVRRVHCARVHRLRPDLAGPTSNSTLTKATLCRRPSAGTPLRTRSAPSSTPSATRSRRSCSCARCCTASMRRVRSLKRRKPAPDHRGRPPGGARQMLAWAEPGARKVSELLSKHLEEITFDNDAYIR